MVIAIVGGILALVPIIVAYILGIVAVVSEAIIVGGVLAFAGAIFAYIFPMSILWPLVA